MPRTAFIVEMQEFGLPSEGDWLTGRFEGRVETETRIVDRVQDLSLDEALAWGRDRAARVLVRHGDELGVRYSAGTEHPPDVPRWPPDDVPVLQRRRIPEDRWLDRRDADAPIAWRVDVRVRSRANDYGTLDELMGRRTELAVAAEGIGQRAGAVSWDIEPLETLIEDLQRAARAAGGAEEYGWVSSGAIAMHLVFEVEALTAARAGAAATERIEVPPGWRAEPTAAPLA